MKKNIKILFIGNSLTYYNYLPCCVSRLFGAEGISADCVMLTTPGKCLKFHSEQAAVRYNILYGKYDYIVLQGVADGFDPESFLEGGRTLFRDYISRTDSSVVLYNAWKLKDRPWSDQETLDSAYLKLAREFGAALAPCGEVWRRARRIHGAPELYAHDKNHPAPAGTYLNSATIFYAITGRERAVRLDEGGVFSDYGIDISTARKMHAIACRAAAEARAACGTSAK